MGRVFNFNQCIMKLKERFEKEGMVIITWTNFYEGCAQITRTFTIGFAEWLIDTKNKPVGEFTIEQLLEIYEKTL